jgi:hypothetical protein
MDRTRFGVVRPLPRGRTGEAVTGPVGDRDPAGPGVGSEVVFA